VLGEISMNAAELAAKLGGKKVGSHYEAPCPAHNDQNPSLEIVEKDGKTLFVCRAGCEQKRVLAALQDLGHWPRQNGEDRTRSRIIATYDYCSADGEVLYQIVRFEPKTFRQRRLDGNGGWIWKRGECQVLYHLPELIAARRSANGHPPRVYVVEGEKDADRLSAQWDLLATTNPGGAGKWHSDYNQYFTGFDVVILPDNDDAGRKHAHQVAAHLATVAAQVRVVELEGLPKGDISDWLDDGGTQGDFEDLIDGAEPFVASGEVPPDPDPDLVEDEPDRRDEARAAIVAAFNAHAWAALNIPKPERLLGEVIVPGSRTFLVGTTGVGKTLIAYEFGGGMAGGSGFLHWTCDRPSRWVIIDGEMPDALIKQRISEVLQRHTIPAENLIICAGRKVPFMDDMPPLNTPEGHAWVLRLIDILKPDGIIFDNLMSLAPGNHAEPDTWLQTVPLVMELTKLGLAQIWCDHTGWDTGRQYGTSTKGWSFDTIGILTPPAAEDREPECLTLNLTFDPPNGKCRRRTPDNWNDFKQSTLALRNGIWTAKTSENIAKPLTAEGRGWLNDITNIFAVPDVAQTRTVSPGGVTVSRVTLTRKDIRIWLTKCGRLGHDSDANSDGKLSGGDRQKLSVWLNKLRDAGKIYIDNELIWLPGQ
jgi:hypothetical protein